MGSFFTTFCYFARFSVPELGSMDEYLEWVLPNVRYYGEDLKEEHFYLNKRWVIFDPASSDVILRIFTPELAPEPSSKSLLTICNGDVSGGEWSYLPGNKMILAPDGKTQIVYDLGFMNDYLMILRQHGGEDRRYLVLYAEGGLSGILSRALGTSEISPATIAELLHHFYLYNVFITTALLLAVPLFVILFYLWYQ